MNLLLCKTSSVTALFLLLTQQILATPVLVKNDPSFYSDVPLPVKFTKYSGIERSGVANVHVEYDLSSAQDLSSVLVSYGDCNMPHVDHSHHELGNTNLSPDAQEWPSRFVWRVPDNVAGGGCLHAWEIPYGSSRENSRLIGRSGPVSIENRLPRRAGQLSEIGDSLGAWFDGVKYLKDKDPNSTFVSKAKDTRVGIIGAGASGLMTALLLDQVGLHNYHLIEASDRLGGRIHTAYLNGSSPDQYQYQEMGPMRFPVSLQYKGTNETLEIQDHRMVFQLADYVNKLNGDTREPVKFIKWIQSSPNTPSGSSSTTSTEAAGKAEESIEEKLAYDERVKTLAANVFEAHKQAIEDGLDSWSELTYLKYKMSVDPDTSDLIGGSGSYLEPMYLVLVDEEYFDANEWKTIDKGLNQLPEAFHPLVDDKTTYNRRVGSIKYDNGKVQVGWKNKFSDREFQTEEFDYAVVSAPFTQVKTWELPEFSSLLSRAISKVPYTHACKVALMYETRFWEKMDIFGGCGSVNNSLIGSVCFPSYNLNGTGPGVLLAQYATNEACDALSALSDEDHIAYVQNAMIDTFGEVANEQFTGIYDRRIWINDPVQAGSWASPSIDQHTLFIPAYHKTEKNVIFVGEHTSYTHAWIWSALESGVRGTVQLLLELGLVDEAKEIVDTWMSRFTKV